jgi:hypothetical protein
MGQISGVDAALITSIAGVAVANISYVGPTSAATIGLGGGGGPIRIFAPDFWATALEACTNGQKAIDKSGPMTLYQQGDFFYYDAELTLPFNGYGNWWWCQTVNFSYQINTEGGIMTSQNCGGGGDPLKTFANFGDWGEPRKACNDGPGYIEQGGETITLYYNQGENRMYNNEVFTEPFSGTGLFYYNQTDNQWWQISGEGYVAETGSCG